MPRILLAEDDDSLRGFLARALERAGYEVTACADGEEAVAVLDEDWDLLLTDIVMPGIDGIEVARQAAARHPGLRIMFITGFAAVALAAGEPGARRRQGAVQAHPPARDRLRGGADDRRLGRLHGRACAAAASSVYPRLPETTVRTRSSAGEHLVDIEGVTGSIPVASTSFLPQKPQAPFANALP